MAAKAADDAVFADAVEELHKQIEAHSMELAALFDEWDHDDNGFVDEEEFVVGLRAFGYCTDANTARIVFRRMDMDGSGRIDFREMKKHCHSALHHKASLMAIGSSARSACWWRPRAMRRTATAYGGRRASSSRCCCFPSWRSVASSVRRSQRLRTRAPVMCS